MGTQTIPTRANAQKIDETWYNVLKQVLTETFVPRNSSGVATDLAGALGSTTLRWLSVYAQKYYVGATASGLSIEEDSGALSFKVGGAQKFKVSSSGGLRATLESVGQQVSGDSGSFSTSSETLVDVTNLSLEITTDGRPVALVLEAADDSDSYIGIQAPSDATYYATVSFFRGSTEIARVNAGGTVRTGLLRYPLGIVKIDTPSAGTYTYKIQMMQSPSATNVKMINARLVAFQLG